MTNVQICGAVTNDSQMVMHTSMSKLYINIEREFKKHLSGPTRSHGLIYHGKDRKRSSKCKLVECEYHVQEIKYVQHK